MSSHTGPVTTTEHDVALDQLYADFAAHSLMPLWTVRGDLMPSAPSPHASAAGVALDRRACRSPSAQGSSCQSAAAASVARSRTRTTA